MFPDTEKKIKSRISSYKSSLKKEKNNFGSISDGSGKRYMLFELYLVLNDLDKFAQYIEWYDAEFPDDAGHPTQKLCRAVGLHRMEKLEAANYALAEAMLANLYLIPRLLGENIQEYDIWHSSSDGAKDYYEYISSEVLAEISELEIDWMRECYDSFSFRRMRKKYIDIYRQLKTTKDYTARGKLLDELNEIMSYIDV